jgi:hypothetical protein
MSCANGLARTIAIVVACGSAGCVRNSELADLRGVGPGWQAYVKDRAIPQLSPMGAAVAVLDPATAQTCRHLGDVTGVVTRRGLRPAGADRAGLIATLPRDAAIADARNLAAAHHADAIVIDADEAWETGRAIALFVHGRALRCR